MNDKYVVGPREGAIRRTTIADADQMLAGWHTAVRVTGDCHDPSINPRAHSAEDEFWRECEVFAMARMRGVQHTMWVVQQPEAKFAIVDFYDGGPDEPYANFVTDLASYPQALLFAAGFVAFEPDWS